MKNSNNFYKDIAVGLFLVMGILGFMSGQFIISTTLFGAASLFSNIDFAGPVKS